MTPILKLLFLHNFFCFFSKKNKHYHFSGNAYSSSIFLNLDLLIFGCSLLPYWEQKARATYEKLIDLCRDNPEVLDPLRYLREREVVHFQRFGEALRGVQDKLAEKKFYMNNNNCNSK